MKLQVFFICLFWLLWHSGLVFGEGLGTLIEVGKSQKEMQKALEGETRTFNDLKEALEKGELDKALTGDEILKKYGEPVLISDEGLGKEKWMYKPGSSDHFTGTKIYLYFDEAGNLTGVKIKKPPVNTER